MMRVVSAKHVLTITLLTVAMAVVLPSHSAETLDWRTNVVSADIRSWDLLQTLERVSDATGWQIFLEPDTKRRVSVKFTNRPPDKALDMLLGDLGHVLLPPTNGVSSRLLVFRTSQQQATQRVEPKPSAVAKAITNELVVTLKPGEKIDDLAKRLGAKVLGRLDGRNTYRLQFETAEATQSARDALAQNSAVESVDSNYAVFPQPNPQSLGLGGALPLNLHPKAVPDGDRIIVGLIDTAVQRDGSTIADFLLPEVTVAGESQIPEKTPTHSTAMAEEILRGTAAGNSSDSSRVRILPVDVYGKSSTTTTFDVAAGITKAINAGEMIINLSLGSEGDSALVHDVIQSGHEQGVIFLAAAGNQPVTTPTYPAAYSEVIAVTAGDGRGNVASYANRGSFVDVVGPGTAVVSFNNTLWQVSGTSPATAFISGLAAGKKEGQSLSWSAVESAIRQGPAPSGSK